MPSGFLFLYPLGHLECKTKDFHLVFGSLLKKEIVDFHKRNKGTGHISYIHYGLYSRTKTMVFNISLPSPAFLYPILSPIGFLFLCFVLLSKFELCKGLLWVP